MKKKQMTNKKMILCKNKLYKIIMKKNKKMIILSKI